MRIHFVLVKPRVPENIGAAARALNTMGFDSLKLVNPADYDSERCRWVACKSYHLVEQAEICLSLEEALVDMDLVIGTTAKQRNLYQNYVDPTAIRSTIELQHDKLDNIAIVFGPEDSGLDNKSLELCDLVSSIPTQSEYGVLNLAQALMIYAYELSLFNTQEIRNRPKNSHDLSLKVFKDKLHELLEILDLDPNDKKFSKIYEKISFLNDEEMQLLHFLRKRVLYKVEGKFTRGR